MLALSDRPQQINQRLIRFPSLGRKAGNDVAEIGLVERRVLVDLSREETFTKRTKGNEADAQLLTRRQQFLFRLSPPKRIFALQCSDRLDRMRATDRLHSC